MTASPTLPALVGFEAFDVMFETVKNWGRWGPDDERDTLHTAWCSGSAT